MENYIINYKINQLSSFYGLKLSYSYILNHDTLDQNFYFDRGSEEIVKTFLIFLIGIAWFIISLNFTAFGFTLSFLFFILLIISLLDKLKPYVKRFIPGRLAYAGYFSLFSLSMCGALVNTPSNNQGNTVENTVNSVQASDSLKEIKNPVQQVNTPKKDFQKDVFSKMNLKSSTGKTVKLPPIEKGPGQWYEGGNLHKTEIKDWNRGTYKNRLATAADMVITLGEGETTNLVLTDLNSVLAYATELEACVTSWTKPGPDLKGQAFTGPTAGYVTMCVDQLGWLETKGE